MRSNQLRSLLCGHLNVTVVFLESWNSLTNLKQRPQPAGWNPEAHAARLLCPRPGAVTHTLGRLGRQDRQELACHVCLLEHLVHLFL